MSRIHLFADDVPAVLDGPASGAGLRAAQLAAALTSGGHEVSVSIPDESAPRRDGGDGGGPALRHSRRTCLDLLSRLRPEVVVWMQPLLWTPFGPGVLHVCDLHGASVQPGDQAEAARHLAGAGLALTGSAGQDGYWTAALGVDSPPSTIVPYTAPPELSLPPLPGAAALRRLHVAGGLHLRPGGLAWLARAAAWCGDRGVELHIAPPPEIAGPAGGVTTMRAIHDLERMTAVRPSAAVDLRTLLEGYEPGSVFLDLADDVPGRRLAGPPHVIDALAHGVPLLTNCAGDLARQLARAGAATAVPAGAPPDSGALEQALDVLAALPPDALGAMSGAAHECAARWFDPAEAAAVLLDALAGAMRAPRRRRTPRAAAPQPEAPPQVLVLSEQGANMQAIRVDLPLGALHREGGIGGYAIWSKGRLRFSTRPAEADPAFDAIWVQRDLPPDLALALGGLGRPYLLDMDDNLLVSPAYRRPFSPAQLQASRSLVRGCTALTTGSDRLAALLQEHAHATLVDRALTCCNLASEQPSWVAPAPPTCVVWASSDTPALTGGYLGIVRAVRDFCLGYGLRLVCIGAPPPGLALEGGVETEHLGMMPYHAYLQHLRSLAPAILVAPLDTEADPATQDFIDGKSDIKVLEALVTGLAGVFSDARPYRDTSLPTPILCRNDHPGWIAGLERARQICLNGMPRPTLPAARMASGPGLQGWADALGRVRLRRPMPLSELERALALTRTTLVRRLLPPGDFDAAWYVSVNTDVEQAVAAGQITAYGHYAAHGFFEGRPGRPEDLAPPDKDGFWGEVLNTLSDVRATVETRREALDTLQARRRQRRRPGFSG